MVFLFIVTESESANGICANAVMQELVGRGNKVICITNREYGQGHLYDKGGVRFLTVEPRLVSKITSYLTHANMTTLARNILSLIQLILNKTKLAMSVLTWPLISPLYTMRIYRLAKRVCAKDNVGCIIPIYKQIDPLIAARKIKAEYSSKGKNIIIIPYFLDSLSGGFGPKIFSPTYMIRRGLAWERRLLDNADCVVVMNSSRVHHQMYNCQSHFYKKFTYLDIPLLIDKHIDGDGLQEIPSDNSGKITVLYAGTLHHPMRNIPYIVDVLSRIDDPSISFVFAGPTNVEHIFNGKGNISYIGSVSHEEVLVLQRKADILLNIGVTHSSAISGKIFEYMSFGKPIISTYSVDNEACLPYLARYSLSLLVDERIENCDEQAKMITEFVRSTVGKRVDVEYVSQEFRDNTPSAMADLLQRITNGGQK